VQASIQDIKDSLRALEAKHSETRDALEELELQTQGAAESEGENFKEVSEEAVFNSPVTFLGGLSLKGADATLDIDMESSPGDVIFDFESDSDDGQVYIINRDAGGIQFHTDDTHWWTINLLGTLVPPSDDLVDIGASTKGVSHIYVSDGAKGDPPIAAAGDTDTGLFFGDEVRNATGGVDRGPVLDQLNTADAYRTTNLSVTNITWTTVIMTDEDLDWNGTYTLASGVFSPNAKGFYALSGHVRWASNATGERLLRILKSTTVTVSQVREAAYGDNHMCITALVYLDGSTYQNFRMQAYQSSGGALNITAARFGAKQLGTASAQT
jgi:hypothetical protein